MKNYTLIFTVINACFALFSVISAISVAINTRKQTKLLEEQNESLKTSDFALTTHLDGIAHSVYSVRDEIRDTSLKGK
ncbi:MAG: hypothetical protein PHQ72_14225 [Hespellia sp.]|nr:hypothetical protein [Hespellia sp.]